MGTVVTSQRRDPHRHRGCTSFPTRQWVHQCSPTCFLTRTKGDGCINHRASLGQKSPRRRQYTDPKVSQRDPKGRALPCERQRWARGLRLKTAFSSLPRGLPVMLGTLTTAVKELKCLCTLRLFLKLTAPLPEFWWLPTSPQVGSLVVENLPASLGDVRDVGPIPGSGRFPWRRAWPPTPVFLPGESHGHRSLVGCAPQGRRVRQGWSGSALSTHTSHLSESFQLPPWGRRGL